MTNTMPNNNDFLFVVENDETIEELETQERWKVVIIDDEPEIHSVTKLALNNFDFDGRRLEFLSAYSGEQGKMLLRDNPDAAVALLDVVMESDHAGLDLVQYIREELKNNLVRIVLRTGQPGQAPEKSVIQKYDINDYKEKTELTYQKLFTLMYSCLRAYRDILTIEDNKRSLEQIIEASATMFEPQSMDKFAKGVLDQLTALFHAKEGSIVHEPSGIVAEGEGEKLRIFVGTGEFADDIGSEVDTVLSNDPLDTGPAGRQKFSHSLKDGKYTGCYTSASGSKSVVHMKGLKEVDGFDFHLVDVFSRNMGLGFENIHLKRELEDTQKEIVHRLSEAVETRSLETGSHVRRVAEISKLLAIGFGLSEEEAEIIKLASPLHDIGKIGVPDAILNKEGKLTADEWKIMQTHTTLGYELLKGSSRPIIQAGAVIALDHHEKWIGGGYPNNKAGEDIHLYGRISALADVFDALGSTRCYKKAWEMERILDLIKDERGRQFDPRLVDIFFSELDTFLSIRE